MTDSDIRQKAKIEHDLWYQDSENEIFSEGYLRGYRQAEFDVNDSKNKMIDVQRKAIEQLVDIKDGVPLEDAIKYIKSRFVSCTEACDSEKRQKCPMFPEFCEGESSRLIDLVSLLNESLNGKRSRQLEEENETLKRELEKVCSENAKLNNENIYFSTELIATRLRCEDLERECCKEKA